MKAKHLPAVCGALTAWGILCASSGAHAAPRTHDGFQFRGALGFGYLSDKTKVEVPATLALLGVGAALGGTISGPAGSLELYFGGTPASGLVLGGFLSGAVATGPKFTPDNVVIATVTANNDVSLNLFTLGPYIDFYPDPTEGFHLLGTLGYAQLDMTNGNNNTTSEASTGFGIGAGVGYDWWVAEDWSLGVLGRFTYASMSHTSSGIKETDNAIAPMILFSVSYQ